MLLKLWPRDQTRGVQRYINLTILIGVSLTLGLAFVQNCQRGTTHFQPPFMPMTPVKEEIAIEIDFPLENQVVSATDGLLNFKGSCRKAFLGIFRMRDITNAILMEFVREVGAGSIDFQVSFEGKNLPMRWMTLEVSAALERPTPHEEILLRRRIGHGLVFLTAGQSNSANHQCNNCGGTPPQLVDTVFLSDSNNLISGADQDHPISPAPAVGELSFVSATGRAPMASGRMQNVWYHLGKKIWDLHRIPVAFMNVGWGGTTVSEWVDENQLFGRLKYGRLFLPTAVLWHQGESDAFSTTRKDYRDRLTELIKKSRLEFLKDSPWFVSRASHCDNTDPLKEAAIVDAQNDVITDGNLNSIYEGPNTNLISHSCHFDSIEQLDELTLSWYEALKKSPLSQFLK